MAKYTVYHGQFNCHVCREEVLSLRLYPETRELTWMCKEKHLSKVKIGQPTKKDYEREK
jgi:hypothetical protein